MRKLFYVVLTIVFLATASNLALAANSAEKIGYVDVARIFDEYKKTQDLDFQPQNSLERATGFEPATFSLGS